MVTVRILKFPSFVVVVVEKLHCVVLPSSAVPVKASELWFIKSNNIETIPADLLKLCFLM